MTYALYRTFDHHLKQPLLGSQCFQEPQADQGWLLVLSQQQVSPVLYEQLLFGVYQSFQQEWCSWKPNDAQNYTS